MSTREDDPQYWEKIASDDAVAAARADTLARFETNARPMLDRRLYDDDPRVVRSVILRVAQYWNDQASDEVHLDLVASAGEPLGLHDCRFEDDGKRYDDTCDDCLGVQRDHAMSDLYLELVPAFEAFCHEQGSQDQDRDDSYRPYAILRPEGIEIIGRLVRPWLDMPAATSRLAAASQPAPAPPHDDLMLALAGNPAAHHALADLLEERGDPRHAAFLGQTPRLWLGALAPLVPRSGLVAEHNVPREIGLYIVDHEEIEPGDGALALAFRPDVRFLPSSARAIWPALAAARSLGPLDAAALAAIARGPAVPRRGHRARPHHARAADLIAAAANLPHVRTLRIALWDRGEVAALRGVKLGELTRIEIAAAHETFRDEVVAWRSTRLAAPVSVAMYDLDAQRASGWCVEPDGSVRYLGFHRHADLAMRERVTMTR